MEIHKKIALARKKKGLTQDQLAEMTNITVRTIQRIENGKNIPRTFTIKTIATALGCTFDELANQFQNGSTLENSQITNSPINSENERHFLTIICLSCFSYLVIPLVHFLIPVFLLKKSETENPVTISTGRSIIRWQMYWVVTLCFLLILTLGYNFISVVYFKEYRLLHYLWVFFAMYIANAGIIATTLWRIKSQKITFIPIT